MRHDDEEWHLELITGLIDGQDIGITLHSPILMSTGPAHWYFSRLAGQMSHPSPSHPQAEP